MTLREFFNVADSSLKVDVEGIHSTIYRLKICLIPAMLDSEVKCIGANFDGSELEIVMKGEEG